MSAKAVIVLAGPLLALSAKEISEQTGIEVSFIGALFLSVYLVSSRHGTLHPDRTRHRLPDAPGRLTSVCTISAYQMPLSARGLHAVTVVFLLNGDCSLSPAPRRHCGQEGADLLV